MSWCAVDVRSPAGTRAEIADWLVEQTGQAVEEREDGLLVSCAESAGKAEALIAALENRFGNAVQTSRRELPEVDWSARWKDGLGPRGIGRLTITPSWATSGHRPLTVVIDPETAFGTGEHGSTRAALQLLDRHLVPGQRVIDLGSGSGILCIAAAKLGAAWAIGIEVDPETEPIAQANALRNEVADRVQFVTGDAAVLAPLLGPADLVVSNILRIVNTALLPTIRLALVPGGMAIFSGMEEPECLLFRPALEAAGFSLIDEALDDGWWAAAVRVE